MSSRRTPAEEAVLLPVPLKVAVGVLTGLHNALGSRPVEEVLAWILLSAAVSLLGSGWVLASKRMARCGALVMLLSVLVPALMIVTERQHVDFVKADAPLKRLVHAPISNPLRFPAAGAVTRSGIQTKGGWFRETDAGERIIVLRGVNFGGSSKIPKDSPTHIKHAGFYSDHAKVTFVGRPCPLKEADEHFARMNSWGFNIVRLLITWEAVEHAGPGEYDYAYLDYLLSLVRKAREYNIAVFIDPHQDVFSRWSGGDGAPGWTLEKVGFQLSSNLHASGATITHQEMGESAPRMVWPTNYARLCTATMFTLFFGGNRFAPRKLIDGEPAQDYLQRHYANAMRVVAKTLKGEPNVLGFDTMNEPSLGYIGLPDLKLSMFPAPLGHFMSAFDGMVLGAGFSRKIDFFSPIFVYNRTDLVNPYGRSAWREPALDVWRQHGLWDVGPDGQPVVVNAAHFKWPVEHMLDDFMVPFYARVAQAIRSEAPDFIVFAEPHINPRHLAHHPAPGKKLGALIGNGRMAWTPHFYDGATLMTKSFKSWFAIDAGDASVAFGSWFASKMFKRNAAELRQCGSRKGEDDAVGSGGTAMPVLVGETGVPFDLGGTNYTDFSQSARALDRTLRALEGQFLSWTLWTYCYDNNNKHGDLWNGEDLSLFSRDQVTDPTDINSGGRALEAAIRPYPQRIAGIPLVTKFDAFGSKRRYYLKVRVNVSRHGGGDTDNTTTAENEHVETVLYLPKLHYPHGFRWTVGGAGSSSIHIFKSNEQGVVWRHVLSSVDDPYVDQWVEIEAK